MYLIVKVPDPDFGPSLEHGLPLWLAALDDSAGESIPVPAERVQISTFVYGTMPSAKDDREQLLDHLLTEVRHALERMLRVPF